jgi:hypothetical protein
MDECQSGQPVAPTISAPRLPWGQAIWFEYVIRRSVHCRPGNERGMPDGRASHPSAISASVTSASAVKSSCLACLATTHGLPPSRTR